MKNTIEYYPKGAMISFTGNVTADDIFDANKSLLKHPDFPNHKFAIWNYQAVDHISYDKSQIKSLATQDKLDSWKNPNRKVAIVSKAPLFFGLARMYAAQYGEGPWRVRVFYDLEKALEWVDLPLDSD